MARFPGSCIAALAFLTALVPPARAIDVETIDVRYESGLYKVRFAAELEVAPDAVAKVLRDYANYPNLDPRIEESHVVASAPGAPTRLYTRLRGCLNRLFCRSMVRVETLKEGAGDLVATAIPSLSDVQSSVAHTEWHASEKGTHVTYTLELDPKFWVPAFYARRAMIETMRTGTVAMFTSV
ncbi:MAG: SRPBCC family protein, partial [Steroidobacteraceae bacterium]